MNKIVMNLLMYIQLFLLIILNLKMLFFIFMKFATNYYLYRDAMKWFWNNYEPNLKKITS